MEISVNAGGLLSEAIKIQNGVKQGNLVAPKLFINFFALFHVLKYCDLGIYI